MTTIDDLETKAQRLRDQLKEVERSLSAAVEDGMSRQVQILGAQKNLAVERDGNLVIFTIRCASHYEAMEVYDNSCVALNDTGTLQLIIGGATRSEDK